jgi:hypothetical protein
MLMRINGIGTTLHGREHADPKAGTYVATRYFTFFYIPLFPVGCYCVRPAATGGWYFLGQVPFGRRQKIHIGIFLGVLLLSALIAVLR